MSNDDFVRLGGTVLLALALAGCKGTPVQAGTQARARVDPAQIAIGPTLKERIKLGTPSFQPVSATMNVAARVEADETRLARVSAPVTGRIVELNAYEGQHVRKGQTIATIYSTELSAAQTNFLKSVSQKQLAERAVARAKQLIDAGVIGEAEVQRRDTELQQAAADVASAREQLMVLGQSAEEIEKLQKTRAVSSNTHILSTIDGVVLERKATLGQVVQAVETVFVVADLSHVWLIADVPEQNAGNIQVGRHVKAEIPALPGQKVEGKLSFVSSIVNPETRTVRVRMNLPNVSGRYKPAMLATMTLVDNSERQLVVPTSAVVREGNTDVVFVQTAPDQFRMREIKAGGEFGNYRVITSGVTDNETIVVDGAFHMNNERRRRALGDEEGAS